MKKHSYVLLIISAFLMIGVGSCTIKKRSYQPGYYVDWHNVNKKSKSNSENISAENLETANEENKVIETVVEQNEMLHYPEIEQDNSPVFSSIDESRNNIEIVNAIEQSKLNIYESIENKSECSTLVCKDIDPESSKNGDEELPVNDLATAGLVLSALSLITLGALMLSDSLLALILLLIPGYIFGILGIAFSATAIIIILLNQDKHRGLWLAIGGLAIPFVLLLLLTIV